MGLHQAQAPNCIPVALPQAAAVAKPKQPDSLPKSPFFRPSNPRLGTIKTPHGTQRTSIVVKEVELKDEEKKSSLLGAYANLCNVTIGAGIVGLVSTDAEQFT